MGPPAVFLCLCLSLLCLPEHRLRRWSGALCTAGPFISQWLFGTHVEEPASQTLRSMGRVLETCPVWPSVASCKLWLMSFLLRERADIVGSKQRANAQTWSGGSTWNALVQGICHSALQLPLPRGLRGLLGGAESLGIWDPQKAFSFPKSGPRNASVVPNASGGAKR